MGKAELKHIPLFNIFFKRMNISVDRSSRVDSLKAFKRANKDLQKGIGIAIFPEATIPPCAPILGNFKSGAFRLAIQNQSPIVPITFLDNYKIFPDNPTEKLVVRPGLSRIIIHAPIETKGLTENDAGLLKKMVFDNIEKALYEHKVVTSLRKDRKNKTEIQKDDLD
jgi:1-acyl-sn-glycerol-3-phosphate acyltransferase